MKKSTKSKAQPADRKSLSYRLAKDWSMNKWKYIMILPVVIYLILFCYKPMYGLVIAFKNYKLTRGIDGSPWVSPWYYWFQNFFEDPYFWRLIKNTFVLSGLTILFGFPAPIILALLLNEIKSNKFKRVVQTITYMPYFISMVVMCSIIKIFCQQNGLFSTIAEAFGGTGQNYLMNGVYFPLIYVLSDIWQGIGWNSIIYLAALTSIDQQLYEAATVDGAGRFQRMWHVTVPGLMPTFYVLLLMSVAGILSNGMDQYLVFQNSANSRDILVLDLYVYQMGIVKGAIPLSTVVGMLKSIISVALLFTANGVSKLIRGESIV